MAAGDHYWIIRLITRDGAWVGTMWHAGDANGTPRTLEAEAGQAFRFDDQAEAEQVAQTFRESGAADQVDVIEWHDPDPLPDGRLSAPDS